MSYPKSGWRKRVELLCSNSEQLTLQGWSCCNCFLDSGLSIEIGTLPQLWNLMCTLREPFFDVQYTWFLGKGILNLFLDKSDFRINLVKLDKFGLNLNSAQSSGYVCESSLNNRKKSQAKPKPKCNFLCEPSRDKPGQLTRPDLHPQRQPMDTTSLEKAPFCWHLVLLKNLNLEREHRWGRRS